MSTVTVSAARASGGVERPVTSTSMAPQIIEAIEAPTRRLLGGVIGSPFAVQWWLREFRGGVYRVERMHPEGTNVKGMASPPGRRVRFLHRQSATHPAFNVSA